MTPIFVHALNAHIKWTRNNQPLICTIVQKNTKDDFITHRLEKHLTRIGGCGVWNRRLLYCGDVCQPVEIRKVLESRPHARHLVKPLSVDSQFRSDENH